MPVSRRSLIGWGVVALVAGCASTRAQTPAPAPAPPPAAAFGGTDRAWLEVCIAMDEQLLPQLVFPVAEIPNRSIGKPDRRAAARIAADLMACDANTHTGEQPVI